MPDLHLPFPARTAAPVASSSLALALALALAVAGCGGLASSESSPPPAADCSGPEAGGSFLRGVCLASCGADLAAFDAELAAELRPVAHVCATVPDGPIAARARPGGGLELVRAHAQHIRPFPTEQTITTEVTVTRELVVGSRLVAAGSCRTEWRSLPGSVVQLSSRMGLSPAGAYPHFGLTAGSLSKSDDHSQAVSFVLSEEDCTFHSRYLARYASATLLAEDPGAVVVQGATDGSLGGLYVPAERPGQVAVAAAGMMQGTVARFGSGEVVVPTSTGHGAVNLALFSASAIADGPLPARPIASGWGALPYDFLVLPSGDLVGRRSYESAKVGHSRFPIRVEGDAVVAGPPVLYASSRFGRIARVEGTSRVVLVHDRGLLVVE